MNLDLETIYVHGQRLDLVTVEDPLIDPSEYDTTDPKTWFDRWTTVNLPTDEEQ
jgi:hypothetical protein